MAFPSRLRNSVALIALVGACAAGPPPPGWQLGAAQSLQAYREFYFGGNKDAADRAFRDARAELARTGRIDLVARVELVRCAVRAATLEFDDCPGFESLRDDAGEEERAYAEYLSGRGRHDVDEEDPLSRLVAYAVRLRAGTIAPAEIASAVDIASDQGWRRPLLAWLAVQLKRAEASGNADAAAGLRRRMELVTQ